MTAKPYAPQSWSDNEPLFMEKLNAMTNNDQYLFENMPTVYYNGHGIRKVTGTKIMSAALSISPNGTHAAANTFYFGDFFSSGCRPLVVASVNSYPQGRLHLWTRGIGTFWPDHRGFEARVSADGLSKVEKITATVWVPFIAVGW